MEKERAFRNALGKFATGIAVVTIVRPDGQPQGITINSFSSVSLSPRLILWSIDKSAVHCDSFMRADHSVVHILGQDQQLLAQHFAGSKAHQFDDVPHTVAANGVPELADCLAMFRCKAFKQVDAGDHIILICEVLNFEAGQGNALLYFSGGYATTSL